MLYTLYHATDPAVAPAILKKGFMGKDIWLANTPWKIGVNGDELIELTFEFDEDFVSFPPESKDFHHVILSADFINANALTKRIVGEDEKNRLDDKFGPPGDWPSRR